MKNKERNIARELRSNGLSIREITKRLQVSKSSVSIWVRDIELTKEQMDVLSKNKKLAYKYIADQAKKTQQEAQIRYAKYMEEGKKLCKRSSGFRVLCGIYWGEGSKDRNVFEVTNCSSDMLRIVGDWLVKEGYLNKIRFRVGYHIENCIGEDLIRSYWMSKLKWLSPSHFTNMTKYKINKESQRKLIGKQPYGTAKVTVCNTRLANMTMGGIEYLKEFGLK